MSLKTVSLFSEEDSLISSPEVRKGLPCSAD